METFVRLVKSDPRKKTKRQLLYYARQVKLQLHGFSGRTVIHYGMLGDDQPVVYLMGLVFTLFVSVILGIWFGAMKKRLWTGFFLGLLLGPIGLVIILLMPKKKSALDDFMNGDFSAETLPTDSSREARENIEALLSLKKLLDAGVVTQEEFEKKKRVLLKQTQEHC